MLLALDWKAFIDMVVLFQMIKKLPPNVFAFTCVHKSLGIPNHDQTITSSRKQHVKTFRCSHETDVM
jgi:hypothetical protein